MRAAVGADVLKADVWVERKAGSRKVGGRELVRCVAVLTRPLRRLRLVQCIV